MNTLDLSRSPSGEPADSLKTLYYVMRRQVYKSYNSADLQKTVAAFVKSRGLDMSDVEPVVTKIFTGFEERIAYNDTLNVSAMVAKWVDENIEHSDSSVLAFSDMYRKLSAWLVQRNRKVSKRELGKVLTSRFGTSNRRVAKGQRARGYGVRYVVTEVKQ